MRNIYRIEFHTGSKEELLPDYAKDFPYIASCSQLDKFIGRFVPWHWHKAVELFYMESGRMEYCTPKGTMIFPAGTGGLVNSNVLHMTRPQAESEKNIQFLHLFDPSFIAGQHGSRIEQKYVTPITTAPQAEIIALYPDVPEQAKVLDIIRESFHLSENNFGYEIKLRETLSDIWIRLFDIARPLLEEKGHSDKTNDKIKSMMVYVHEHYAEKISIPEIAAAAYSSERECFRVFHDFLHMTPVEYIKNYRLQTACRMLTDSRETITYISHACGLGSSSYFGKVFREYTGCTPLEYRRKWQENDI
ncbi:AraC family transcriptional regulator [Lacrimispora sphenoides]|uniref:AraC-type DNA-binding protein n=1 Tax=Lacrimispora sphenoides JCM 1415 TaxID=1297793 RepID=A0ABY1CIK2_9FIRM|nr:AraC-type DNA-binding protein [[Clostridium] sphenoides JCM 1415]SUY49139.1 AraC family transcriptional regulator [Lacrimispora sphenoides]